MKIAPVEACLRQTRGIRDVGWLTTADRRRTRRLEEAAAGLNAGLLEVLGRRHVLAVLNDADFRHDSAPCVQWVADGVVIGEEVTDAARRESLLASPTVGCMGERFVLYYDRMTSVRGMPPTFVFRPLPFAEVEACGQARDAVSCSPGAAVDSYIKQRFSWPRCNASLGTILIGFNTSAGGV